MLGLEAKSAFSARWAGVSGTDTDTGQAPYLQELPIEKKILASQITCSEI